MRKLTDVYDEVTYIIPKREVCNFYSFFSELDIRLKEFDIKSYGVVMPSLEDVFLQITSNGAPGLIGDFRHPSDFTKYSTILTQNSLQHEIKKNTNDYRWQKSNGL